MSDNANPFEPIAVAEEGRLQARFRLRPWFAMLLYGSLVVDFFTLIGSLSTLFPLSAFVFFFALVASVVTRQNAVLRLHEKGIFYRDLVQQIDVSWDRVVSVRHKRNQTEIVTDSFLAMIPISARHEMYETVLQKLDSLQAEFGFAIIGSRK